MFAIIVHEKGGAERREVFDTAELTVGRVQGNELMLPKGNVSKRHARLLYRDGRFIVKHKTQSNRLTRKLTAMRQEAWRLMHRPLAEQHRWYTSVLRGHYGYFGMPHNWRALNGFLRQVRRIWFNCLRRRSQKSRRMGWAWFEDLTSRLPLPRPRITHPWTSRAV